MTSESPANVWPSRADGRMGGWADGSPIPLSAHPAIRRSAKIDPQILPHRVDTSLDLRIHHDLVRPIAREAFFLPLPRRVDAHLRAVGEPAAGVVEHVDRSH